MSTLHATLNAIYKASRHLAVPHKRTEAYKPYFMYMTVQSMFAMSLLLATGSSTAK